MATTMAKSTPSQKRCKLNGSHKAADANVYKARFSAVAAEEKGPQARPRSASTNEGGNVERTSSPRMPITQHGLTKKACYVHSPKLRYQKHKHRHHANVGTTNVDDKGSSSEASYDGIQGISVDGRESKVTTDLLETRSMIWCE